MWIVYAILGAFFGGITSIIDKRVLLKEHATEFSAVLALFVAMLSLPFLPFADFSLLTPSVLSAVYLASLFGSVAFILLSKAIRHLDLSVSSPFLLFGPAITALMGFLILGERLSFVQMGGIGLIMLGGYILQVTGRGSKPIKYKYILFIVVALLIYAVGSSIDRYLLGTLKVPLLTYLPVGQLFVGLNMIMIMSFFKDGFKGINRGVKNFGHILVIVAALTFIYRYFHLSAVSLAAIGLVAPIKYSSSLFVTIVGGEIFHEEHVLRKTLAALVMFVGVCLIII